jgi:hypothetical protein
MGNVRQEFGDNAPQLDDSQHVWGILVQTKRGCWEFAAVSKKCDSRESIFRRLQQPIDFVAPHEIERGWN